MAAIDQSSLARIEQPSFAGLEIESNTLEQGHEAQLVSRLQALDIAAFDELVTLFERQVYSLCYRMLGDPEESRDAAQETFLKIYRGMGRFRGECGLKTWIYRIAINQAMNQQRWWRRRHKDDTVSLELSREDMEVTLGNTLPSCDLSPEDTAIAVEREQKIMQAMREIKDEYRAALLLREVEELSYEEIAETLRISVGTVKSRIARGREELRKRLRNMI